MFVLEFLILFAAGMIAGVVNSVAGGGSLLTLPALIFAGIPATEANATNRIGVLAQAASSSAQFHRKGVKETDYLKHLWPSAMVGAIIGIVIASQLTDAGMEGVIGVLMLFLLILVIFKPPDLTAKNKKTKSFGKLSPRKKAILHVLLFTIGFYGGFIQAGMGIFTLLALGAFSSLSLMKANYLKLIITVMLSVLAIILYPLLGVQIHLYEGFVLCGGQIAGSWIGTSVALKKGEKFIRITLIIMTVLSSGKLLGLY